MSESSGINNKPKSKLPEVKLFNIENVSVSFKKGAAKVSFSVSPDIELLRLVHLAGRGYPLDAVITSPQAEFDLTMSEFSVSTGEIK